MNDKEFDKFLGYFNKSSQIPVDVTPEKVRSWYDEVLAYVRTPEYEYTSYFKLFPDKVIKIGIANCWLREKLLQRGYDLPFIANLSKTAGRDMFTTPSPIWKVANNYLEKCQLN